mmetsp:Transcript_25840/g.54007  ORF Transcript_25840/g.54007 Transcript_25840/m.54007 type:complete len:301 (-) Transcript_25840:154-1056(-)
MRIRALLVVRFLCLLVCICICICICICGGVVPPHFQQERKAPDRSVARRFVHHEATKGGVVGPPVGSRDQKKGQHERPIHGARQVQDGSGSTGGRGAVRTGRCGVGHGTIKDGRVVVVIAGIRVVAGIRVGLRKGRGTGFVVDAQVRGWASVCQGCGGLPDPPVPIVFFFFGGCRCRCRCRCRCCRCRCCRRRRCRGWFRHDRQCREPGTWPRFSCRPSRSTTPAAHRQRPGPGFAIGARNYRSIPRTADTDTALALALYHCYRLPCSWSWSHWWLATTTTTTTISTISISTCTGCRSRA